MFSFIKKWFVMFLHFHEWEIIKEQDLCVRTNLGNIRIKGSVYYSQCKVCGKIKRQEFKVKEYE